MREIYSIIFLISEWKDTINQTVSLLILLIKYIFQLKPSKTAIGVHADLYLILLDWFLVRPFGSI